MSSSHDYEPKEWPSDSSRIDAIAQNGNTGEHYSSASEWVAQARRIIRSSDRIPSKYERSIKGKRVSVNGDKCGYGEEHYMVDVYDVLVAFDVKNPALQHAIKKMLCTGIRGYKDFNQDIDEAIQALERAKEL